MKTNILLMLSLFCLISCATTKDEEREIEQKAAQNNVTDAQQLSGSIEASINESKNLTEEQKQKLRNIMNENKVNAQRLSQESFKYRGLLVQELFSGKSKESRIRIIKNDISRVEKARLNNTYDTIHKMSEILNGHPDNQKFADHFMNQMATDGSSRN